MAIKYTPFLFSFLACCLFVSCHFRIETELKKVEHLLDNHPDSALSILSQINTREITGERTLAHYALLKSAALDKNYIDIGNDSIISIAKDYYQKKSVSYNRMRSFYYYGVVKKNASDYVAAVISFEKALQDATLLNNLRYLGLSHRNMAAVFNTTGNMEEAKRHIKIAIGSFEKNLDTVYAESAKYSLAINYINENQMDSSRSLFNELRYSGRIPSLKYYASIYYANTLVSQGDSLNEALAIYRRIPKKYFGPAHYGFYAKAFAMTSQLDSARKWMIEGYKAARTKADSAKLHSFVYPIDLMEGHPQIALDKVIEAMAVQDSYTRQVLLQSLSVAQMDYYQQEASIQKARAERRLVMIILGSIIFLLVLLISFLFLTKRQKEKESLLKEQMAQFALEKQSIIKGNSQLVGSLFLDKMARLCSLSSQYYLAGDEFDKKVFLDKFKNAVKELKSSPDLLEILEKDLNQYCSGIMNKLTEQVPGIKGDNRSIAAMFFAGIPDALIQIIMKRASTGSLKTLRSRLRQRIVDAHAPDEELFLKMLSTEKATGKENKSMRLNQ